MIEPNLRNALRQAMLDAERLGRYLGSLAEVHRRGHRNLRFILLFAAVGGITGIVEILPVSWAAAAVVVSSISGIVIIALVIWDFMAEDGKKAAILHAISIEFGEYELRLRSLWLALNRIEPANGDEEEWTAQRIKMDHEVQAEIRAIEDGMLRATARAGYADISEDERANQRATDEAYQVVEARFALERPANG